MISLVVPTLTFLLIGLVVIIVTGIQHMLRNRPRARVSARDRLLRTNPWLDEDGQLPWSDAAQRVRVDRLTVHVVAAALLVATLRPTVVPSSTDDTGNRS